ncbi:MAG: TatD family hydrolase [Patescibacteria group bacterium]
MQFVDTHCHIQDSDFSHRFLKSAEIMISEAAEVGVSSLICIGTTLEDSQNAQKFCTDKPSCYATAALHPHEISRLGSKFALEQAKKLTKMVDENPNSFIAIGECGLDYFYHHDPSDRAAQAELLRIHLDIAQKHQKPLIFHVREAFDEFWPIFDEFKGLSGVIHSFSATNKELNQILSRELYVGLNGIMTFTKDQKQLGAARAVPLNKLLLETDAPFLTPKPFRGKMCEPRHLMVTAEFLAKLRGESLSELAQATTKNAKKLFSLK